MSSKKKKKPRQLSADQKEEVKKAFEVFDADGSGAIDVDELEEAMDQLGFKPKKEEIIAMIAEVDQDGSGEVDLHEFEQMMAKLILGPEEEEEEPKPKKKKKRPEMSESQKEEIKQAFEAFDTDGSGAIDCDELSEAMKILGLNSTPEEVKRMIDEVDTSGSGEIEFPEFLEMMRNLLEGAAEDEEEDKKKKKKKGNGIGEEDEDELGQFLITAAQLGDLERARKMASSTDNGQLPAGVVNAQDSQGRTALTHCVNRADMPFVTFLVSQMHNDINQADQDDRGALHHAVLIDCADILSTQGGAIVEQPGDRMQPPPPTPDSTTQGPDASSGGPDTARRKSPRKHHLVGGPIVRLIARAGAELDARDKDGFTPLMLASMYGVSEAVKDLLEIGAKPDQVGAHGYTAVDFAVRGRDSEGRRKAVSYLEQWSVIRRPRNSRLEDLERAVNTPSVDFIRQIGQEFDVPRRRLDEDLQTRCDRFQYDLDRELGAVNMAYISETQQGRRDAAQRSVCEEVDALIKDLQRDKKHRVRYMARLDTGLDAPPPAEDDEEPCPEMSPDRRRFPGQNKGYPELAPDHSEVSTGLSRVFKQVIRNPTTFGKTAQVTVQKEEAMYQQRKSQFQGIPELMDTSRFNSDTASTMDTARTGASPLDTSRSAFSGVVGTLQPVVRMKGTLQPGTRPSASPVASPRGNRSLLPSPQSSANPMRMGKVPSSPIGSPRGSTRM